MSFLYSFPPAMPLLKTVSLNKQTNVLSIPECKIGPDTI